MPVHFRSQYPGSQPRHRTPPEIPQATAIPTLQPTPTVQPTPEQDLPPALVETDPLPLTEIGPKTSFTFFFNQPMERGSVQDALQADPAVAGSFQWMNDATVKFIPDKPLPVNTHLDVSFSTRARAANGLALSSPVDITFQTAEGFKLVDQLPKPGTVDIDPTSADCGHIYPAHSSLRGRSEKPACGICLGTASEWAGRMD